MGIEVQEFFPFQMATFHTMTGREKEEGRGKAFIGWKASGNTRGAASVAFATDIGVSV
jgi:hypothetical protein